MVQLEGLRAIKGVHSFGCVGCGEESWSIETVVGVELGCWGLLCVESGRPGGSDLLVDS
jgi:hypothetical protein